MSIAAVEVMKRNVALETVLNRTARALGNLAMDAEGSGRIHSAGNSGISLYATFSLQIRKPDIRIHFHMICKVLHQSCK